MVDIARYPWAYKKILYFLGTLKLGNMWPIVANEIGVEIMWVTSRLRQWKALFSLPSSHAEINGVPSAEIDGDT